ETLHFWQTTSIPDTVIKGIPRYILVLTVYSFSFILESYYFYQGYINYFLNQLFIISLLNICFINLSVLLASWCSKKRFFNISLLVLDGSSPFIKICSKC